MPVELFGQRTSGVIHICVHCGEKCNGKYCNECRTAEGRHKVDLQNRKIRLENEVKGYVYR